ncbi:MAG: fumarylacetoacetate hydrolase family protein [Candidatus Binatia bacterium]
MKVYLGLLESSRPDQTKVFGAIDNKLVDLQLAYAACLKQSKNSQAKAYELAAFSFPGAIGAFLERSQTSSKALDDVVAFARKNGVGDVRGPTGERVFYDAKEVRLLPPFLTPDKSFVIGFSDKARTEALPKADIPTAYYKLPQTFVPSGAPIMWPKFSEEIDADACLAIVIGKPGRRVPAESGWDHVAGFTLVIDITARDINKREGVTTNNLLGKNFPSSTCIGPAALLQSSRKEVEGMEVELSVDGAVKQKFALRDCVFTVEQIIARWSILGIKPGDWFAIGASMAMAGDRLQNPVPLRIGSTVRCAAAAIGELSHKVVAAGEIDR